MISSLLKSPAYAILPVAGAFLGWLSWISGASTHFFFISAIALSWLWGAAPGRKSASLLFLGYFLAGAMDTPEMADTFGVPFGKSLWIAHAALLALPFGILHGPTNKALRFAVSLLVTTLPPLGILGWLSPLLAAGVMFPGWGLAGLGGMLVVLGLVSTAPVMHNKWIKTGVIGSVFFASVVFDLVGTPYHLPAPGWFGQNTAMGRYPTDIEGQYGRHQTLMDMATASVEQGAKVVLFPEEIAGEWGAAVQAIWGRVDEKAKEKGATVLLGASTIENGDRMNSLVAIGADSFTARARLPMPVSMWKPWSDDGYKANIFSSGLYIVQGEAVAASICYEDFLLWPLAWSFIAGQPVAVLSAGNNWFGNVSASRIQRTSIELQARLYGVPLIRAVNDPPVVD